MPIQANLKIIAEAIGAQFDEETAWFDRETGEVVVVSSAEARASEENHPLEDYPEWQHEMIEVARKVINDKAGRYLALPSKWDFHEYDVMEEFCLSLENEEQSEYLLDAIRGRGAFRMFKDVIHKFEIQEDWYRFRDKVLHELATKWAGENDVDLSDG